MRHPVTSAGIALRCAAYAAYDLTEDVLGLFAGRDLYIDDWLLHDDRGTQCDWHAFDWDALAAAGATPVRVFRSGLSPFTEADVPTTPEFLGNAFAVLRAIHAGLTPEELDRLAARGIYLWFLRINSIPSEFLGLPFADRTRRLLAAAEDLPSDFDLAHSAYDGLRRTRWLWFLLIIEDRTGIPPRTAARWLDALRPDEGPYGSQNDTVFIDAIEATLTGWATATGLDGWVWAAAGYTQDEARTLLALPETNPARPGPDQLAVMAALRRT